MHGPPQAKGERAWTLRPSGCLLGLVLVGAACGRKAEDAKPAPASSSAAVTAAEARAEKAASRLIMTLLSEMMRAVASRKPEEAVDVCASVAQKISAEIAAEEGIDLRRTALRIRNPKNAPDEYERKVLEGWLEADRIPDKESDVVTTADGKRELRYLKPIILKGPCVTCHGPTDDIDPAVRAAIREHYPDDRATGFRAGDLRGAVTARVPLEE